MGMPVEKRRTTVEEYLRMEEGAVEKHEFRDGEIIMMPGGTFAHSLIIANTSGELRESLKGKPCLVLDSNLKVGIARIRRFVYPDVLVICGGPQFDARDNTQHTITNPRVIVEVLSPSTEAYDRGEKFNRYRDLESFEEYVLIAQHEPSVQTFFRQADGTWLLTPYSGLDAIVKIRCLSVELSMAEIYAGVEFQPVEIPEQ